MAKQSISFRRICDKCGRPVYDEASVRAAMEAYLASREITLEPKYGPWLEIFARSFTVWANGDTGFREGVHEGLVALGITPEEFLGWMKQNKM